MAGDRHLRIVRLQGGSMAPYLLQNDILWVELISEAEPKFGEIVMAKSNKEETMFAHRYLCGLGLKGDRSRSTDTERIGSYDLIGIVRGRMGVWQWVLYDRGCVRRLHSLQGVLSRGMLHRRFIISDISRRLLFVLSFFCRRIEEVI